MRADRLAHGEVAPLHLAHPRLDALLVELALQLGYAPLRLRLTLLEFVKDDRRIARAGGPRVACQRLGGGTPCLFRLTLMLLKRRKRELGTVSGSILRNLLHSRLRAFGAPNLIDVCTCRLKLRLQRATRCLDLVGAARELRPRVHEALDSRKMQTKRCVVRHAES